MLPTFRTKIEMDIQKIFDNVANRELAYAYLIRKVAETPLKKDRVKIATYLINHLQKEQDELSKIKIYNTTCKCGDTIDTETGLCLNCG